MAAVLALAPCTLLAQRRETARVVFDRFLRGSLEDVRDSSFFWAGYQNPYGDAERHPQTGRDTLTVDDVTTARGCGRWHDLAEARSLWLADYRILSVRTHGDRGEGVVRAVAVAEQRSTIIYGGVRHRTLRFRLLRSGGRWRVCFTALDGTAFGSEIIPHNLFFRGADVWAPLDSIQRRRRHRH